MLKKLTKRYYFIKIIDLQGFCLFCCHIQKQITFFTALNCKNIRLFHF